MLRELLPENPVHESNVALVASLFFLVYGLFYRPIADYAQRKRGQSERMKELGVRIMRPVAFLFAALGVLFALLLRFR